MDQWANGGQTRRGLRRGGCESRRTGYGEPRPAMKPVSGAGGTRRNCAAGTGAGRPRLRGWAGSGATRTVTVLRVGEVESGGADRLRGLTTSLPEKAKPVGLKPQMQRLSQPGLWVT